MCEDRGIPIVSYIFGADLNFPTAEERAPGLESVKEGIDIAAQLGAPCVLIPTGAKHVGSREQARRNWIAGLKDAVPIAQQSGIALTIENFPGKLSAFVTAADVRKACREVPGLRLAYDSGNAFSGEDPAESYRQTADLTVHAHFKDWDVSDEPRDGYREMLNGKFFRPALIGEGDVPHHTVLQAMKECGYDGCINIEYEWNEDPYEGVRNAVNYLRKIENELG